MKVSRLISKVNLAKSQRCGKLANMVNRHYSIAIGDMAFACSSVFLSHWPFQLMQR